MSSPMHGRKINLFKVIKEERQLNRGKPGFVRVLVFFCRGRKSGKSKIGEGEEKRRRRTLRRNEEGREPGLDVGGGYQL